MSDENPITAFLDSQGPAGMDIPVSHACEDNRHTTIMRADGLTMRELLVNYAFRQAVIMRNAQIRGGKVTLPTDEQDRPVFDMREFLPNSPKQSEAATLRVKLAALLDVPGVRELLADSEVEQATG